MKTNSVTPEPKRQDIAVTASLEKDGDRWIVNQWELAMLAGIGGQGGQPAPAGPPPAAPEGGQPAPQPGN
jgi:Mce-associated membrane protein